MRHLLFSLFALFSASIAHSQQGSCTISTADSSRFLLSVNGVSWGDSAQQSWTFVGMPGSYELTLLPVDSAATLLSSSAEVSPGVARSYVLMFGEDLAHFFLAVTEETVYAPSGDFAVPEVANANRSSSEVPLSVSGGSAYSETLTALREAVFQKDRIALIETFLLDQTLTVYQLTELLSSIDAEDQRLQLALKAVPKLTDPQNASELDDLFYLSNSREHIQKAVARVVH